MRAAFVVGDRVNLIDDDRGARAQMLAALLGGEPGMYSRFGRRDQGCVAASSAWRAAPLRACRRSAPRPAQGAQIPTLQRQLLISRSGVSKIFLDVVRERLQRRNVTPLGSQPRRPSMSALRISPSTADEKCGQRLAPTRSARRSAPASPPESRASPAPGARSALKKRRTKPLPAPAACAHLRLSGTERSGRFSGTGVTGDNIRLFYQRIFVLLRPRAGSSLRDA